VESGNDNIDMFFHKLMHKLAYYIQKKI